MKFARSKRQLLGWAALFTPLPLPLNDVVVWPVVIAYSALVTLFLQRVERGTDRWLGDRTLNLLGLAYAPILFFDLRDGLFSGQVLRPFIHLVLFLVVTKLWSLRRERDKWHTLVALFFLFLASMASSTHLAVIAYLLTALGGGFWILARFAQFHAVGSLGDTRRPAAAVAQTTDDGGFSRRFVALGLLAVFLGAVPIFAFFPRLREPVIFGSGGTLGGGRATGFSDSVDLSLTSTIRGNRSVALRLDPNRDALADAATMRFKGAAYDLYRGNRWLRAPTDVAPVYLGGQGEARLGPGRAERELTIYREPMSSNGLLLPLETVIIDIDEPRQLRSLFRSPGGALSASSLALQSTAVYRASLRTQPLLLSSRPRLNDPDEPTLAVADLSPRITALAAEVMNAADVDLAAEVDTDSTGLEALVRRRDGAAEISATGSTRERIARLERHLLTQYSYTLDFVGRDGRRPIEDFLFEYRSGHCEYFATAMVLMLRSQGVPARFVTGFLGAEANPLEGYFVVRQQNAHAWVEAWTEEGGWEVWDPTPPEGRPAALERTWRLFAQQVWDYVVFRWDRYVLTYGAADQEGFFRGLRDRLAEAWRSLWDSEAAPSAQPEGDLPTVEIAEAAADEAPERSPLWQRPWVRWTGLGVFLMLALLAAHLARRRPLGPAEAYLELRSLLANDGLAIDAATAPLQIRRLGREHLPAAGEAISRLVDRYLVQSFGGRSEEVEAAASRADLNTVRQAAIERRRALRAAAQRNAAQRSAAQRNAAQQDSASTDRPRAA